MLEIFLGQVPEAIYFALFMILTKRLKEKRLPFVLLMSVEYVLLFKTMVHNMYAHIGFFIITFLILKLFYKEKCQITDVFTLAIAGIILIIFNIIVSPLFQIDYILSVIIIRILMFLFLYIFRNKLWKIQEFYKKAWNRKDKPEAKIKSLTFRSINLVIFNIMFYIINLGMLLAAYNMFVTVNN